MLKRLGGAFMAAMVLTSSLGLATAASAQDVYYQCVRFAREFSGIQIFGDAHTWWGQAQGEYRTGRQPEVGAVLVFRPTGRMTRGHVAVVSNILTERVVRISHANWGGSRGRIERDVTVVDVSPDNDWSQVRVWHNPSDDLGVSVYPTYGFIYQPTPEGVQRVALASEGAQSFTLAAVITGAMAGGQP